MWARFVVCGIGIWLMAAPAVLTYEGARAAANNDRIVGPIVASIACVAMWEATRPLRWVNLLAGVWLIAAPLILHFPRPALINSMACGVVVAALALVRGRLNHSFGGGWRSLLPGRPVAGQP